MFYILLTTYILTEAYMLKTANTINFDSACIIGQAQICLLLCLSMMTVVNPSPKWKSSIIILFIGSASILLSRIYAASEQIYYLVLFMMSFGLLWASVRPYEFISDELSEDTVFLLFYKSDKGTWLMHVLSLIGLPVSSMSVVCDDEWLRLVHGRPTLEIHPTNEITKNYIAIDTGIKINTRIRSIFRSLRGKPAVTPNSLFLRVRCIAAIKPLLTELGREWQPKTIFQQIPSTYFYKAVWNRTRYDKA